MKTNNEQNTIQIQMMTENTNKITEKTKSAN